MAEKCFCHIRDKKTGECYTVKDATARKSIEELQESVDGINVKGIGKWSNIELDTRMVLGTDGDLIIPEINVSSKKAYLTSATENPESCSLVKRNVDGHIFTNTPSEDSDDTTVPNTSWVNTKLGRYVSLSNVDTVLSATSENPIQNKAVNEALNKKADVQNSNGNFNAGNGASGAGTSIGHGSISKYYTDISMGSGANANGMNSIALGYSAKATAYDSIQLGTGTNSKEKTLQVHDDNIYNANTHTLTVKNIELDGEDIKDKIGAGGSTIIWEVWE